MTVPDRPWSADSETGVLRDVLLCRPDHYRWIPTNDIARRSLAGGRTCDLQTVQAHFAELESALADGGVRCHYLEPDPALPYQVYTRDSSQVTPWGAVLTQLERPQRRGEVAAILAFYGRTPGAFWNIATAGAIEGGDIHIIGRRLLAIGYSGGRTDLAGAEQFAGWFAAEGWDVCLVPFPDHFLHLDVIFSMVGDRLALACTSVLDDAFLDWLSRNGIAVIDVTYKEAMHDMACNVLALGEHRVISPRHSRRVNAALRAEGLTVLDPRLDAFTPGGGSVHCMTMPLRRDPL